MVYLPRKEKEKEKWREVSSRMTRRCPVCEGTGKIKEKDEQGNTVEVVCPMCDGSGFLNV